MLKEFYDAYLKDDGNKFYLRTEDELRKLDEEFSKRIVERFERYTFVITGVKNQFPELKNINFSNIGYTIGFEKSK